MNNEKKTNHRAFIMQFLTGFVILAVVFIFFGKFRYERYAETIVFYGRLRERAGKPLCAY